MQSALSIDGVLKRDRLVVMVGLVIVAALAWAYMFYLAWNMRTMGMDVNGSMSSISMSQSWGIVDFSLMFVMWAVMMVAMMVPTAAPMILMFATINRRRIEQQRPYVPTSVFLLGYLAIWFGFALFATSVQWGLHQASLLSSMMGSVTPVLGGGILIVAGVFQWTPFKNVCLKHCRTPIGFIMSEWREGGRGALVMGVRHGGFCLGCCWFLMGLMFVAGVMNILWMAGIASYMLIEKVVPPGRLGNFLTWGAGAAIVSWGVWMIVQQLLV